MKKVLLATSAIVAFTGAAAAQNANISIAGEAEMGLAGGDRAIGGVPLDTQFWQDVDIKFTMQAESDSGLTFGAVVDLDEAGGLGSNFDDNGTHVFISGSFGTLTLGDTDSALDWALTEAGNVGNPGSIADDETEHAGYNGSYGDGRFDNQILRYDHTIGAFAFAISYEQGGVPVIGGLGGAVPDLAGWSGGSYALGVKYALDMGSTTVNLGLGYKSTDTIAHTAFPGATAGSEEIWGLSVDAAFAGGFSAGIVYSDWSDVNGIAGADDSHWGLGLGYTSGAFSVHANYGEFDSGASGFGLAAAYDLGGGLSAKFGYGSSDTNPGSADTWSLGMAMKF